MCWVAMDRGLRLADKRSLPCPNRDVWLKARDKLYDEIQTKGYNHEKQFFGQSYENNHVLDAAVLIMPLVFFMPPSDPRFQNTLKAIMRPRDRGGSARAFLSPLQLNCIAHTLRRKQAVGELARVPLRHQTCRRRYRWRRGGQVRADALRSRQLASLLNLGV